MVGSYLESVLRQAMQVQEKIHSEFPAYDLSYNFS
jgi:hypothetical protein